MEKCLANYLIKGYVKQRLMTLQIPLCNERGYLIFGFVLLNSKEYENTAANKKNMLVKSCLFTVTDTNTKLRLSAYSC